jgi:phospholipid/cholesterol/gamma-HCH transport system permease protein
MTTTQKADRPSIVERFVSFLFDTVLTSLRTLGRWFMLASDSFRFLIVDTVMLRHPLKETIRQCWFITSVTAVPALLVSVPFGIIVMVQVGNITQQIGAASLTGAAGGLGVIRQGAPIVAALLLGGAAGSAIAADLGARTIREEIDAMRVIGINPTQRLVAPRLAAMLLVAPMLCLFIVFITMSAGYILAVMYQDVTPGSYLASLGAFAKLSDVYVAVGKALFFGVVVVVIACQRGLETKFGPRGVAESVNAAVVLGVLSTFVLNVVATQIIGLFLPEQVI